MTKADIIDSVYEKVGLSKKEAEQEASRQAWNKIKDTSGEQ